MSATRPGKFIIQLSVQVFKKGTSSNRQKMNGYLFQQIYRKM